MTDFISLLQSAAFQASELILKREEATDLRWHLNYKWLINPPVQCPWCEDWLPTGRVWVVDEAERKVRRVWKLNGKRLDVEACHPHVGSGGMICMGNARTAVDALTASLSDDAYVKPWKWLPEELGHRCPTMRDPLDDEDDEDTFTCYGCDERYDRNDSYYSVHTGELYCSDCYWEVHSGCDACGGDWHRDQHEVREGANGNYYCSDCFSERFFECEGCEEVLRLDQRFGDDLCESCYSEKWESCRECGEECLVVQNELDDEGLCESCRPEPEEEEDCEQCATHDELEALGQMKLEGLND